MEECFEQMQKLSKGWDGNSSSEPPNPELISIAKEIVFESNLAHIDEPEIGAGTYGEVELFWQDFGLYLTLYSDYECSISYTPANSQTLRDVKHTRFKFQKDGACTHILKHLNDFLVVSKQQ